jgi:tetratricopeptide (TPR) repeat protein
MLIGLDYFLSHRIYVSQEQRRAYITWNGGPVFALDQAAHGTYDTRYAALPQAVAADNADALARRGAAALAAGKHALALEDLNRACELAPGVASHFYDRARVHGALRQAHLALADLDEALRIDPSMAEARMRRAVLRRAMGHRTEITGDLLQLDATLPPAAPLRIEMGRLWASLDDAPAALRQFDLWIGSHADDVHLAAALNERCWLRTRLGIDLPLALEDCKDAVDKDSGEASFFDSLGWTYLRMGNTGKALRAFDDAIRIKALPISLYGRGLVKLRRKDAEGAEVDMAEARRLQPQVEEYVRKQGFDFANGDRVTPPSAS